MAGAIPNTHWLDGCVALDAKGFIKTGTDLSPDYLAAANWPLAQAPYFLETSVPSENFITLYFHRFTAVKSNPCLTSNRVGC